MIRILGALLTVVLLQFITGKNDSRIPGPAGSCGVKVDFGRDIE
jgi:hypothetical protein